MMQRQPFRVQVPQETLDDLQARLAQTRWPDDLDSAAWDYGTNLDYLKSLVTYWQHNFSWRDQEEKLNEFAHFHANIDGLDIHFVHERGIGPNPLPIILTHGWPGSFFELSKLIPMLTHPEKYGADAQDSFDVIAPSLPGFGFSQRPSVRGVTTARTAELWARLMLEVLNYPTFVAGGGDIGSSVTQRLALAYPQHVRAIHLTYIRTRPLAPEIREVSEAERKFLDDVQQWATEEGAYARIQATKPQTLAYGLNDSPVGLAAWIIEKFRAWSDCNGNLEGRFNKDELLTNIMLYWVTETISSSIRMYYEDAHVLATTPFPKCLVPTGIALFPKEISRPPRAYVDRFFNVQHWAEMPRGGHFAAMEEPELLAKDLRAFFRPFRDAYQPA